MLTQEKNDMLTRVGAGKPMGELLRRYWMPVAGVSEFDEKTIKPIRLLGEDLVLYKDLSGRFGMVERRCPHRRADLAYGMVEQDGIRCSYHGWCFDAKGACTHQPFEDATAPERNIKAKIRTTAYPVQAKAGLLWVYLGPQPAPLLPDWEPFSWENGFTQVVISVVPCNWFQCQENSIDPVHFEWMHENWGQRLRGEDKPYGPTHVKLDFEEFEHGLVYKRIKQNTNEADPMWTVGRVCLWPNGFFLGEHFEWRVPIDDENTLSVTWKFTRVPKESEPYVQESIPTWYGPVRNADGSWIDSHVMNQDFLAWVGQGAIADRTRENLASSDRGVALLRKRMFEEMEKVKRGEDPKGTLRDPANNHRVALPVADRQSVIDGFTREEILANPRRKLLFTSYIFQAGQPEAVRAEFAKVMGLQPTEFRGLPPATAVPDKQS
ncbi:MAG: aromatic ring-hydroxylating dioxygenase subunit alpha [Ramlibacter sp.]|jgi:5,5'-dehydrodivanillate O-demethylase|nr:aromatic ring-hydroxylating dioxygenase subunit alpha [Ramlibacter sp.]